MPTLRWRAIIALAVVLIALGLFADGLIRETATDLDHARRLIAIAVLVAIVFASLVILWLERSVAEAARRIRRNLPRLGEEELDAGLLDLPAGALDRLAEMLGEASRDVRDELQSARTQCQRYAAILEQMTDAVVAVDEAGHVQFVNRAFARLFELDPAEAIGQPLENATLNFDLSALVTRALQQGQVQRDRLSLRHPHEAILEGVTTPLTDHSGRIVGAVGLLHDITQMREANRIRQDFVANASHELRTPAAGIKALAEALQAGAINDPRRGPEFCRQIVAAADRLTATLDDMLTLTRVERGARLFEPELLEARAAIKAAIEQVAPAARLKGIEVRTEIDDGEVFADPAALQTLLVNLLDNAVKYTPEGGTVTARGRTVPGGYEVAVIDTGPGIPEEHLDRIFERFYRVDRARDRATGSTGLGLSIVRHIAETHGGRVRVESEEGEGSKFTAFFPSSA